LQLIALAADALAGLLTPAASSTPHDEAVETDEAARWDPPHAQSVSIASILGLPVTAALAQHTL
jgi:hypothetical protein